MLNIGYKLVELRKNSGKTMQEVADSLGCGRATLGHWEKGDREPSFEMLDKIANHYNIPVGSLFSDDLDLNEKQLKEAFIDKILKDLVEEGFEEIENFDNLDLRTKQLLLGAINTHLDSIKKNTSKV